MKRIGGEGKKKEGKRMKKSERDEEGKRTRTRMERIRGGGRKGQENKT